MISNRKIMPWLGLLLSLPLANAVAQPALTIGAESSPPGAEVTVPVSFTNDGAVVAMSFDIAYDPALVSPGAVAAGVGLPPHTIASAIPAPGTLRVVLMPPLVAPLPVMNSGVLLNIPWTVAAGAKAEDAALTLTKVVFSNAAAQSVPSDIPAPGRITITTP